MFGGCMTETPAESESLLRLQVYMETGFQCAMQKALPTSSPLHCSARPGQLHVHHIVEVSSSQDNNIRNLIALCPNCHYSRAHGGSPEWKAALSTAKEFLSDGGCLDHSSGEVARRSYVGWLSQIGNLKALARILSPLAKLRGTRYSDKMLFPQLLIARARALRKCGQLDVALRWIANIPRILGAADSGRYSEVLQFERSCVQFEANLMSEANRGFTQVRQGLRNGDVPNKLVDPVQLEYRATIAAARSGGAYDLEALRRVIDPSTYRNDRLNFHLAALLVRKPLHGGKDIEDAEECLKEVWEFPPEVKEVERHTEAELALLLSRLRNSCGSKAREDPFQKYAVEYFEGSQCPGHAKHLRAYDPS